VLTSVLLCQRRTAKLVIDAYKSARAGDLARPALLSLSCDLVLLGLRVGGDSITKQTTWHFAEYTVLFDERNWLTTRCSHQHGTERRPLTHD
jgi:hypothetical protein